METGFVLELVPLRGEPHPRNEILVPIRGSFKTIQSFQCGILPNPLSILYAVYVPFPFNSAGYKCGIYFQVTWHFLVNI